MVECGIHAVTVLVVFWLILADSSVLEGGFWSLE